MARKRKRRASRKRQPPAISFRTSTTWATPVILLLAWAAALDLGLLAARVPSGLAVMAIVVQQIAVAPFFFVWFSRAYRNLPACDVAPRHGRFWVFWAFVIPIINLIRPYRMLDEIWRSAPDDPDDEQESPVGIWWLSWLMASVAPSCATMGPSHGSAGLGWVLIVFAVAAVLAIRMVRGVTARQERAVPVELSGVAAELERADAARARVRFVSEQPSGDAYREFAEDWVRVEGASRAGRPLELGPEIWRTRTAELPLRLVERVLVRRSVGWLPMLARYSVRAAEPDGGEHTLLTNLSASDARVAMATLEQRLELYRSAAEQAGG